MAVGLSGTLEQLATVGLLEPMPQKPASHIISASIPQMSSQPTAALALTATPSAA